MYSVNVIKLAVLCLGVSSAALAINVGTSCTITDFSQVAQVVKNCNNIIVRSLTVPAGKTLRLNLKTRSSLTFEGTTTFEVANWAGPLVSIAGKELKVKGEKGSILDGQGAKYWDGKGGKGSKKPVFIAIKAGGEFDNINLINCPQRCASIKGSQISLSGWNIDVSAGDVNKLGHNTDGFDVSGHGISIVDSVVKNQDDCLVVNRGTNMYFRNLRCSGGHGLSLSVGMSKTSYDSNVVSNVTFTQCSVIDSDNGIHIKTHKDGATGLIKDVTYSHITLQGIKRFGMQIHQNYPEDSGVPIGNVPIRGLTMTDVKGTMAGQDSMPVQITCASGACSDWKWSDVSITGNAKPCSINYYPSGFSC